VFGPQTLHRLPQLLDEVRKQHKPVVDISFPEIEKFDALPEPRADGVKAFVSVMEGCSKYCTFCVVPYTRGEEISRPLSDVLLEITSLAKQGVREVNLLGQNVNAYRGMMDDGEIADFSLLLHYVAAVEGIDRIRFTTSHPVEFTDSLIEAFAEIPQLVDHLHLPVQSGSDAILKAMKRGHTAPTIKKPSANYAWCVLISACHRILLSVFPMKPMPNLKKRWHSLTTSVLIYRSALSIANGREHLRQNSLIMYLPKSKNNDWNVFNSALMK